jgi:nucleoside-diphosphate-sugar epimerase
MKIVVIGGTGLIGSKLVAKLREHGHEALPDCRKRSKELRSSSTSPTRLCWKAKVSRTSS